MVFEMFENTLLGVMGAFLLPICFGYG